jgi:hypothetical protein
MQELQCLVAYGHDVLEELSKNTEPGNIYYVPLINQHVLKIVTGSKTILIRGNPTTIYDRKQLRRNSNIVTHQVVACKHANNCNRIRQKKYCKFYHDPIDLLDLVVDDVVDVSFYRETIKHIRKFSNTSWLYVNDDLPHFRNTFTILDPHEYEYQLMNDIFRLVTLE